jgi:ketosteroid isomerase-like protein
MKPFKIVTTIMISIMILGCTQKPAEPAVTLNKEEISDEILKNWNDFILAFNSGDIEKTMSYFTDDYINMPSFEVTQNYEETKDMFQGMINNFSVETNTYKQTEIFVHPDMAYQFGNINMVLISRTTGDTVINRNRSVSVWKKTEDGSWKLYRWIGQG